MARAATGSSDEMIIVILKMELIRAPRPHHFIFVQS